MSRLAFLAFAGIALWIGSGVAQSARPTLAADTIAAGGRAQVRVEAAAGTAISVTVTGPATVSGAKASATTGTSTVNVGPFVMPGEYQLAVSVGSERTTLTLRVEFPPSSEPPPPVKSGVISASFGSAAKALADTAAQVDAMLQALPPNPQIDIARREWADARRALNETVEHTTQFRTAVDRLESEVRQEPNLRPAVRQQFDEFASQTEAPLREQSEQLLALGRSASAQQPDPCIAVEVAGAVMRAQRAMLDLIRQGIRQFLSEQLQDNIPEFEKSGAHWARHRLTGGRPLRGETDATIDRAAIDRRWSGVVAGFQIVRAGIAGGPWAAAGKAIENAIDIGLAEYTRQNCLTFTGEMSGTTLIESLENGERFYGLQNGWQANVRLSARRPTSADTAVALRGAAYGRGRDFRVINQLETLYRGRPAAHIEYLTAPPPAYQQALAMFVSMLEGTLKGDQLALKVLDSKIDYAGRVHGKLAVIVVPLASPVPLVQTFPVTFQGGHWQLVRAIGVGGVTTQTVVEEPNRRVVRAESSRELTATGLRGRFTIKMNLCGGPGCAQ